MDTRINYQFVTVTDNISGDVVAGYYDTARIETEQLCVIHENLSTLSAGDFEPLPDSGRIEEGKFYSYNGRVVYCRQPHERTIYPPEETPALFSFYRDNIADLEWIEGEKVEVGWTRMSGGKKYECLQPHQTQVDYTPEATLNVLWKEVVEGIGVWKQPTGAHDAYNIGDRVHFPTISDSVYESLINANVWSPAVYPTGWKKL